MLEITFISLIRSAFKTSKSRYIFSKQCLFGYSQDSSWTTKEDLKQKHKGWRRCVPENGVDETRSKAGDVSLRMVLMKSGAGLEC